MSIYVYDPYLAPETVVEWGATPLSDLEELAGTIDVLSLHIPATPETHHLIDRQVLNALKPTAILISAARGTVMDEVALVEVLQAGRIYGAGIDVYDPEPPAPDNPLFKLDRVVLSPHVASRTEEGRRLMGMTVVEDILRVLDGEKPKYMANPEVWRTQGQPQ
jgi:D-3-phosphoglycerate dehydrogenase